MKTTIANPRLAPMALLLAAALGCETGSILGPIDPSTVTIELGVSGGIAGQSFRFRVDGDAGEVRGVECVSFCSFSPGELIAVVSRAQVTELARALEDADVFAHAGTWPTPCCDQIEVDLLYSRGDRTARVEGSTAEIPTMLAAAVARVMALGRGSVPAIVAPDGVPEDWPRDDYAIDTVAIDGAELLTRVTYSGGCAAHPMDLIVWGGWLESFPVQVNALITHDGGDDPCDGIVVSERVFDLTPIRDAYIAAYGPFPAGERVVLRLWDPVTGEQSGRLLEYVF